MKDLDKARALVSLARELSFSRAMAHNEQIPPAEWRTILTEAADWFRSKNRSLDPKAGPRAESEEKWADNQLIRKNDSERPLLFTDGASRGNPGPAAAGGVVYLGRDRVGSFSRYLGRMTNNQAEYEALLLGLELIRELGFREVSIRADSQLMVRQVEGRYKVKDAKLKGLYQQVKGLLKDLDGHDIIHIDRGLNKEADALANEAFKNR